MHVEKFRGRSVAVLWKGIAVLSLIGAVGCGGQSAKTTDSSNAAADNGQSTDAGSSVVDEQAFQQWLEKLNSDDETARWDGAGEFMKLAFAARQSDDERQGSGAGDLDPTRVAAVPMVVEGINLQAPLGGDVNQSLCRALIALDTDDLNACRSILKEQDSFAVRLDMTIELGKWVVNSLGKPYGISNQFQRLFPKFEKKEKAAVQALSEALKDPDPTVRQKAAEMLGEIGPHAKPAEQPLRDAMANDESDDVKFAATSALFKIVNPEGGDSANP
ncbi:MAG: HEAT repeat domain-containing protein [Pirellulaceae bacterium]